MKLLICCWLVLVANSAMAMNFYMVIVDSLNVRQGPDFTWDVITKAERNQLVLETQRDGVWSEIFYLGPNKQKVKGWVHNNYIKPQTLTPNEGGNSKFNIKVSAEQPVCDGQSMITGESLCYLDVNFSVRSRAASEGSILVSCWADFVASGQEHIQPVQAKVSQNYVLQNGRVADTMRLRAGLKQQLGSKGLNVAYYNCTVN
ncbi:SH3 domain-containing protein [Neptuniibacter marinus]|uniref:SH3 domain-containing protein n=1 Tax=Neptuniibacter marinus TaxID=1806670 RepID=UPI003B5B7969